MFSFLSDHSCLFGRWPGTNEANYNWGIADYLDGFCSLLLSESIDLLIFHFCPRFSQESPRQRVKARETEKFLIRLACSGQSSLLFSPPIPLFAISTQMWCAFRHYSPYRLSRLSSFFWWMKNTFLISCLLLFIVAFARRSLKIKDHI